MCITEIKNYQEEKDETYSSVHKQQLISKL